jgi:hypothetical protein
MGTTGFLLAGLDSGEAVILDQGRPPEVRQKFKSLVSDSADHDYIWLRYFSDYGDVKKKVFKKRLLKSFDELETVLTEGPVDNGESYTGEDIPETKPEPIARPKRRR